MEIKFYWNGSFLGCDSYEMEVDGEFVNIDMPICINENEAKELIIKALKNKYNLDYTKEQIEFSWGGRL